MTILGSDNQLNVHLINQKMVVDNVKNYQLLTRYGDLHQDSLHFFDEDVTEA